MIMFLLLSVITINHESSFAFAMKIPTKMMMMSKVHNIETAVVEKHPRRRDRDTIRYHPP